MTATDSSDQLVSDAQRLGEAVGGVSATDIAAPGQGDCCADQRQRILQRETGPALPRRK